MSVHKIINIIRDIYNYFRHNMLHAFNISTYIINIITFSVYIYIHSR